VRGAFDTETSALILTVDTEGLTELVGLLEDAKRGRLSLMPAAERRDLRPVGTLSLEPGGDDAVAITTDGEAATITGSRASFARLARELRQFGAYNDLFEPGMHAHFDPGSSTGGVFAQSSDSLIIAGPVPDEAASDE
jgi:hypothetical protein